jgi:hypothetical protein
LTVAKKLPIVEAVQNKVESAAYLVAAVRRILVSERVQTRPAEKVNDRLNGPANLSTALAVIVELPATPLMSSTPDGLAERVKSCTVRVTLTD